MALAISNTAANAAADAVCVLLNSGYVRIYSGAKPSTADTAITTQTLLAEPRFNSTAFGSASAGVATANAFTTDSSANNSGTATWFRAFKSDGTTAIMDGTCGTTGADMILPTTTITSGVSVNVTSFQYSQNKS